MKLLLEFIEITKKCKRNRITSYINNWWRYNSIEFDLNTVHIDKIKKYKKSADSDNLLKLGELLIESIDNKTENIVDIFTKLYNMEGSFSKRFSRKDAVYLFWEIVEDKFKSDQTFIDIFNFALSMFNRKQMTERRAFGVWICIFVWKYDKFNWNIDNPKLKLDQNIENYIVNRTRIEIDEDYVVNDFHVNRKFGLDKFAKVGSTVINEDFTEFINGKKYQQFYVAKKAQLVPKIKEKINIPSKKIVFKKKISNKLNIDFIDWKEFTSIKVIDEGVCGLKVPCIKVNYKDKTYIIKEMRKSFNYGRDYLFLDSLKPLFNIKSMNMKRIKSNFGIERVDLSIKTFRKNWKFEKRDTIYCLMDYFENIGDLGKNKHFLKDKSILKECLKIRLYDGLFRSSDNILRNILVNKKGELLSIDEGDIYGKRKSIFNKNDFCAKTEYIKLIDTIITEFDLKNKLNIVEKNLKLFKFENYILEMKSRFNDFNNIVIQELC